MPVTSETLTSQPVTSVTLPGRTGNSCNTTAPPLLKVVSEGKQNRMCYMIRSVSNQARKEDKIEGVQMGARAD